MILVFSQLSAETVRLGAFCDYFTPKDPLIQEVYGANGDILYGLRLNVMVYRGLAVSISYGQFKKTSNTTELDDLTRLTLNPLTIGVRYTPMLGKVNPFVELAYVNLSFKEESDIGNSSGKQNGWSILGGVEFLISERFGISLDIKTQDIDGPKGSNNEPVNFKGLSGGLSFFVRI